MPDYSKTIIYSIICNTNDSLIYVGHTTDFTKRKTHHKSNSKNHTKLLYQTIRENGGWDNFTMKPIMEFPCENITQACIQEQKCMNELKTKLNMNKAHQTIEEKKEYDKQHRIDNKEHYQEYKKAYREEHKEHIQADAARYYQEHKEERKAYRETIKEEQKVYKKEWYVENKEEINKKRSLPWTCECGVTCSYSNKARHLKTHNI